MYAITQLGGKTEVQQTPFAQMMVRLARQASIGLKHSECT